MGGPYDDFEVIVQVPPGFEPTTPTRVMPGTDTARFGFAPVSGPR